MVSRKNKKSAVYHTPETRSKKNNSTLLTMHMSCVGEVPMLFYIPDAKARENLQDVIEAHGGMVVDKYEAYVYQIKPTKGLKGAPSAHKNQFHVGFVYQSKWITDSITNGRLEDPEDYLCGFNKTSNLSTLWASKRVAYTISEVLRIFDLVEEQEGSIKKLPSMKFFNEIFAKNYIPDRSAASLRTAFKKFSVSTRRSFVKAALKNVKSRFSHNFVEVPESKSSQPLSTKGNSWSKNLSSVFNSASTKPNEEPSPPLPQVDLNVMTNQPSLIGGDEDMEFVLEVEDMQSAISNTITGDSSYNIKPTRKRRHNQRLDDMYSNYDLRQGHKRVKITEAEPKQLEYNESESTIYDQESLLEYISTDAKVKITHYPETNKRVYKSKVTNNETFFQRLTNDLENLCERYGKTIEEMHALFMSWCWDMDELRKALASDQRNHEWGQLEDIAVLSEPGSVELDYIVKHRGEDAVKKRREFLEF